MNAGDVFFLTFHPPCLPQKSPVNFPFILQTAKNMTLMMRAPLSRGLELECHFSWILLDFHPQINML